MIQPPSAEPVTGTRNGGRILADQLRILGADTVFCVPGESFLALLDGLYDNQNAIKVYACRHEAGAANMADAYAKLTGKPGIVAVTRGPGATNASNGIHTAYQDSTPLIVLIGQVGRSMLDREAFQEVDYRRMFGQMAKLVVQVDQAERLPEYISRAWHLALSGRPGPVVLALPEDMLRDQVAVTDCDPATLIHAAPTTADLETFRSMLAAANKPLLVIGGPGWRAETAAKVATFAERTGVPVATAFRYQDYIDNRHPAYAGVIGIAPNPQLRQFIQSECDLLIGLGPRFGEMTTQGYELINIPRPQMPFIHIHPDPSELTRVYRPDLAIVAAADAFFDAATPEINLDGVTRWAPLRRQLNARYQAFREPTDFPGTLNMGAVVRHLTETMPDDVILTNGAGNYTVWPHRFHEHRAFRTQLGPTSGSMGYGVPAAIAAKLTMPHREVVSFSGDGCFLMLSQDMATAAQYGAAVIYLVINNGMFGTIRMHQERHHPGRTIATDLRNPDFVTYAAAFGIGGEKVTRTEDFPAALARARQSATGYLIELIVDPEALTPTQTLSDIRQAAQQQDDGP